MKLEALESKYLVKQRGFASGCLCKQENSYGKINEKRPYAQTPDGPLLLLTGDEWGIHYQEMACVIQSRRVNIKWM